MKLHLVSGLVVLFSGALNMFWAGKHLTRLEAIHASGGTASVVENGIQTEYLKLGIAGLMIAAGLALATIAIARGQKMKRHLIHG